jgi:hypothetical protein
MALKQERATVGSHPSKGLDIAREVLLGLGCCERPPRLKSLRSTHLITTLLKTPRALK